MVASRGDSCLRTLDLNTFSLAAPLPSPVACPRLLAFDDTGERAFVASSFLPEIPTVDYGYEPPAKRPTPPKPEQQEGILCSVEEKTTRSIWAIKPSGAGKTCIARIPRDQSHLVRLSPDGMSLLYDELINTVPDLVTFNRETGALPRICSGNTMAGRSSGREMARCPGAPGTSGSCMRTVRVGSR